MDKEKRTLQQNFKVLESLLLAKRELLKNQGVSFTELDSLISVKAELLVNGFNEIILEKYDKKTVDEKTADKKSEMPCNCHKEKNLNEKIINAVVDSVKKHLPPDTRVIVFID